MTTLIEKINKYEIVKRGNCPDCGNPWWFSEPLSYVCTMCAKTIGRSTSDLVLADPEPIKQCECLCKDGVRGNNCFDYHGGCKCICHKDPPEEGTARTTLEIKE